MFKLKLRDYLKGLLLAVVVPVLNAVLESLNAGAVVINWQHIWELALSTAVAYLLKNLLTDDLKVATKVIKSEASEDEVIILPVDTLPASGVRGVWYFYNGEYYYWNAATSNYTNAGGDRPTRPPHNA